MTEPNALSIRPLASCLAAQWHELWKSLVLQNKTAAPDQDAGALFALLTAQNGVDGCLIVERDGKPVGLAHYRIERGSDPLDSALQVTELALLQDAVGTGAGARLVAALYMTAEAHRTPLVYWTLAASALRAGSSRPCPDQKAA